MRLRQIEIFYHVYRFGSISDAARELHVSQPSVSKVLRYAEDQLGFPLFRREKGRLFATPAADELFQDIKEIYDKIGAVNRAATNIRKRKGGHVRLGILPSLSLSVVPAAIAALRREDTHSTFEIMTLHTDEQTNAMAEKKCDVCLRFGDSTDDRFISEHLADAELVLVAKKRHISANGDKIDLKMLHDTDFIGIRDTGPAGEILASALEAQMIAPREIVTTHTYYSALSLVRFGVGVAVVDQFTAGSLLADGLEKFHFSDPLKLPIFALSQQNSQQSELISNVVAGFRKAIDLSSAT